MPTTWFTSDYHLGHRNIIRLCNRPFANVEEMDQAIIERHNACVGQADTVYDLGDFAFRCSAEYAVACLHRLNGRRHLVLGNHDKPLRQAHKRGLLDELIESGRLTLVGDTDPRIQTAFRVSIEGWHTSLSAHGTAHSVVAGISMVIAMATCLHSTRVWMSALIPTISVRSVLPISSPAWQR